MKKLWISLIAGTALLSILAACTNPNVHYLNATGAAGPAPVLTAAPKPAIKPAIKHYTKEQIEHHEYALKHWSHDSRVKYAIRKKYHLDTPQEAATQSAKELHQYELHEHQSVRVTCDD